MAGQLAVVDALAFTTTTAAVDWPRNIQEAVKQAGLKAFEIPIQETPACRHNSDASGIHLMCKRVRSPLAEP